MFDLAAFQAALVAQLAPAIIWGLVLGICAGLVRLALGDS